MAGKTSRTAKVREADYRKGGVLVNEMQHLPWASVLSPSGLVPAMCNHGLKTLPVGHPSYAHTPSYAASGGELPPLGHSWVRAKYVTLDFRCIVCHGQPSPPDLTEYRT